MNLKMLQTLFILSWAAWACMPVWGATAFAAMEVLTLFALWQRMQKARKAFATEHAAIVETFDEPTRAWLAQYPYFYTQRTSAKEWSRLLRAIALALLLLVPVFAVHALVRRELVLLLPILPAAVFFFLNTLLATPLEVDQWVAEPGKEAEKPLHDAITNAFAAGALAHLKLPGSRLRTMGAPPPEEPPQDPPAP